MILLNFSHPLTADHLAQLESLTGQPVERVVDAPVQFNVAASFVTQVGELADGVGLTPLEWQTLPILVNPPALNVIAANVRWTSPLNLKREGLADALNAKEWRRGTPPEQRWAGHDDHIGSPRPAGSRLKGDDVLAITVAML